MAFNKGDKAESSKTEKRRRTQKKKSLRFLW